MLYLNTLDKLDYKTKKRLEEALVKWWDQRSPSSWTEDDHLRNPTINSCTTADHELSSAIGLWLNSIKDSKPN